jgi:RHS repeat-associated protein
MDAVFARIGSNGGEDWHLTDHLGSVRGLENNSGTIDDALTYNVWGAVASESIPTNGDSRVFAGYLRDNTTGLYDVAARWYTPQIMLWVSPDPLGLRPDSNYYRYVHNSPTNATDPSGLLETVPGFARYIKAAGYGQLPFSQSASYFGTIGAMMTNWDSIGTFVPNNDPRSKSRIAFDVQLRQAVIAAIKQLQKTKIDFIGGEVPNSDPEARELNLGGGPLAICPKGNRYWIMENEGQSTHGLDLKPGESASKAIDYLLKTNGVKLDCASATFLIYLIAVRNVVGEKVFDANILNIRIRSRQSFTWPQRILFLPKKYDTYFQSDWMYIRNPAGQGAWKGENVILMNNFGVSSGVARDFWTFYGFGVKKGIMSYPNWQDKLMSLNTRLMLEYPWGWGWGIPRVVTPYLNDSARRFDVGGIMQWKGAVAPFPDIIRLF